jgi:hypothetical protein
MSSRDWRVWCALALLSSAILVHAAETLRVVPLVGDHEVLVSFELPDAYNDEVRETIASGLRTTFTYNLDLRLIVPFWADRTVATSVVSVTNGYDNLTGRHSLERRVDGRVVDALVTQDEDVVKRWLTTWNRLPLCRTSLLEPNRDYYVRVSARGRPQVGSLVGWAKAFTGQARFTFIP